MDGYPTFDNNTILNLPTGILEKIEVYNTAETLQSLGYFSYRRQAGIFHDQASACYRKSSG
jgi:hypothetical protein